MECVYCELPEIKERIIVSTKYSFAFPTNIPIVPGHTLVCPLRCVKNLEDLSKEELFDLFGLISKIKKSLIKTFNAEGFNYAWNEGKLAGQNVNHLHIHVLPRKTGDTGITQYEPRQFLYRPGNRKITPESELKEVTKLIKRTIFKERDFHGF